MSGQDSEYISEQMQFQRGKNDTLNMSSQKISDVNDVLPSPEQAANLNVLILGNNKIKTLPQDLSNLRNLRVLDLRSNPLDFQSIIPGLRSLTNLSQLYITATPEQENFLRNYLGDHVNITVGMSTAKEEEFQQEYNENHYQENEEEHINNIKNPSRQNNQSGENQEITLQEEDLLNVAKTFDQIRDLYRQTNPQMDQRLNNTFNQHVKNIMEDLHTKIDQQFPEHIINTHILKAKYALYDICFAKMIDYVSTADPNIADVLQKIHDTHALIFKDLSSVIIKMPPQKFKQQFAPNYLELKEENEQLQQQIKDLQADNQSYLKQIVKHSKGMRPDSSANKIDNLQSQQRNQSPKFNNDMKKLMSIANQSIQSYVGPQTVRSLTIRQLKEVIEEIYKSKQMYDKKYQEAQLPRETMEQHTYTYLNQKYGLKGLIIEWFSAIVNGIRNFNTDDNDIAVFGKILKNECDEEFRFVQNQVKNTIQELLKMYLRGRYPYKHNSEIKQMVSQKMEGWVYEEEAIDIIKYMYNEEDSQTLTLKVKQYIDQTRSSSNVMVDSLNNKKITREQFIAIQQEKYKPKIEYIVFQKMILDFQLKSHEKFLKKFIQLFRSVDKDLNGIIDEEQFKSLLMKMDIRKDENEVQRFLSLLDPFNKQQITFSQCVTLFSSEVIETNDGQRLSILQKIQSSD